MDSIKNLYLKIKNQLTEKRFFIVKIIAYYSLIMISFQLLRFFINLIPHSSGNLFFMNFFSLVLYLASILINVGLLNFNDLAHMFKLIACWVTAVGTIIAIIVYRSFLLDPNFSSFSFEYSIKLALGVVQLTYCLFCIWFLSINEVKDEFKKNQKPFAIWKMKNLHISVVLLILLICFFDSWRFKNELEEFLTNGGVTTYAKVTYTLDHSKQPLRERSRKKRKRKSIIGYEFHVNNKKYLRRAKLNQDIFNSITKNDEIEITYSSKNPLINYYINEDKYKDLIKKHLQKNLTTTGNRPCCFALRSKTTGALPDFEC